MPANIELPEIPASWFLRPDGVDGSRGIHGIGHTLRVWVHADALASDLGLPEWEREAVSLAATWHDIGRTDDAADYYHGGKSAGKVVGLGLHQGVDPLVLDLALFAVTWHCGDEGYAANAARWTCDEEAAMRVLSVLKDADALDRVRLGDLDESWLRFAPSYLRVERAWELLRELG